MILRNHAYSLQLFLCNTKHFLKSNGNMFMRTSFSNTSIMRKFTSILNFRTKSILHVIYGIIWICWNFLKMKKSSWLPKIFTCYLNLLQLSGTHFYWVKEWIHHYIILICGHMAQNPYFPGGPNLCLMGDIQVSPY